MYTIYLNDVTGRKPQKDFKVKTLPRIGETITIDAEEIYENYKVLDVRYVLSDTERNLISLQIDVIKL